MCIFERFSAFAFVVLLFLSSDIAGQTRQKVMIKSSLDGTKQPCYVMLSKDHDTKERRPLVVLLHTWSGGVEQRQPKFEEQAMKRNWVLIFPGFRGPNQHPDACGSIKAQQDILDAVSWAKKHHRIDEQRIYLTGVSGGGHMTMLMAGRHPKVWTAASAWVGISDLGAWHKLHANDRYGQMMRKSCGGAPGDSKLIDQEYRARSPLTFLKHAVAVPLDIAAGIHDGHRGSVPIRHSLDAFNEIAKAAEVSGIAEDEINELSQKDGRLTRPKASDRVTDKALGREIHLRRTAAKSRVTIFEGGHEGVASAAFDWLEKHRKR